MVDKKWAIVSPLGQQDNEPKEVEVCWLEDSQSWSVHSTCVSDGVLVARILPDTRAVKHGKGRVLSHPHSQSSLTTVQHSLMSASLV